jgi:uncharacterized metal-binding protein YceD (DUF177 family)
MNVDELWIMPVPVDEIPADGGHFELQADPPTRAAIARAADLVGLDHFAATFDLTQHGRDGVHVVGTISADVQQTCVVTLEPMASKIREGVDLMFAPKSAPAAAIADGGIVGDGPEPPEPLTDGAVDLGTIAVETLLLAIDPYPRKPDAVFASLEHEDPDAHPFAVLAALKKPDTAGK